MKGTLRREVDETRPHLQHDYRDPPPRQLPPVPKYVLREKEDKDSILSIKSNDEVWDRLRSLKLLKTPQPTTFVGLRNRQRNILLNMPKLTPRQLRREKMPAHMYIPLEMAEDKFDLASFFLKYLVGKQEILSEHLDDDEKQKKFLKHSPKKLEILAKILKCMNIYIEKGKIAQFVSLAFYSGVYFEKKSKDWWWLANEFFLMAKDFSGEIKNDSGYSQALIAYIYGKFLLIKEQNFQKALECLLLSRALSKGKIWNAEWITGVKSEHIYENSSLLTHIALLFEAESFCYENTEMAMENTKMAIDIAKRANFEPYMKEAMFDYAVYACQANNLNEAFNVLDELLKMCGKSEDLDLYLCVQFLLAECLIRYKKRGKALRKLDSIAKLAKKIQVPGLIALAYRFMGQIYINKDKPSKGLRLLEIASKINLHEGNDDEFAKCDYLLQQIKDVCLTPPNSPLYPEDDDRSNIKISDIY